MPTPAPVPSKAAAPKEEEESAELVDFRQKWLAELQRRKADLQGGSSNSNAGVGTASTVIGSKETVTSSPQQSPTRNRIFVATSSSSKEPAPAPTLPADHPALNDGRIVTQANVPPSLGNALNIYRRAVEQEQKGDLDEALILYRQAFRLDDNVDRAYRREQMLKSILNEQEEAAASKDSPVKLTDEVEDLSASFQSTVTIKPATAPTAITGTLAELIREFPSILVFEAEDENVPLFLNTLPEELLVMVIGKLDPTSIERFACVSRKARVLTLDPGIWRELVRMTYKPPQITDHEAMLSVVKRFLSDYRRVFVEHPRVRLDGVYIAICHYVRPGLSENAWVNISHLITYHRYLRFFPNGQVLSLLANEEKSPQEVIPILKPTLRMEGLFLGHWKLIGTTVHLSNLIDASGRFALPSPTSDGVVSGGNVPIHEHTPTSLGPNGHSHDHASTSSSSSSPHDRARYVFDMTLNLRSRPIGRWNRMDIQAYDSVSLETGDVVAVALKHERPFWFSKVRSYT